MASIVNPQFSIRTGSSNGPPTLCGWRGFHVVTGSGTGTGPEDTLWSGFCKDCGAPLGWR